MANGGPSKKRRLASRPKEEKNDLDRLLRSNKPDANSANEGNITLFSQKYFRI